MQGTEEKYETKKNRGETKGRCERSGDKEGQREPAESPRRGRQAPIRSSRLAVHRNKKPVLV